MLEAVACCTVHGGLIDRYCDGSSIITARIYYLLGADMGPCCNNLCRVVVQCPSGTCLIRCTYVQ